MMAVYKRFSPNIRSAFSIVMAMAIWLAFAPTQVGGLASYIIIIGKSMEPKFHKGDLVIVHKEPTYEVGDVIVYSNTELQKFVFHRIISQQLGQYTLKGDNNSWVDDYKPSHGEVMGKLWLHIPRGGTAILKLRSPFMMALIAGALGAVLATSLFSNKAKGIKTMNNKSIWERFNSIKQNVQSGFPAANNPGHHRSFNQAEIWEGSFFALGLVALGSLILGIISFSRPASRVAQDYITYQHLGVFSYASFAPPGVYDADTIRSGDPIFTKLTCSVDVNFQYTLVAAQAENSSGTYQMTAVISEPVSGWQRVVPLQEQTAFHGTAFGSTARLDLCKIESLTQSMQEKTASPAGSYTLVVTPRIKLNGEISGRALESSFDPALTFHYDGIQFYLVRNEEGDNPFALAESEILSEKFQEANTMLLLGHEMAIPALRLIALFGLIGSLIGLTLLGVRLQRLSQHDQEEFFHIKYSSMMIDVQNADSLPLSSTIDVASMDALAKLAERFNAMILHLEQGVLHTYYVQAGGTIYRFTMKPHKTGSTCLEDEAIGQEGVT
jgi:signal peptidase I